VEEGSYVQPIQLTGTVEALRETTIASEQQGVIERLLVEEGDRVSTGALLLSLRQRPLELELAQARAEYRADQAVLEELQRGSREEDLRQRAAELEQTRADLTQARRDLDRSAQLLQQGTISQENYDAARARFEALEAQVDARQAALQRAEAGPREEEILKARADADARLAEAQLAQDDLERASIEAPYSGVITHKYIDVGSWVSPGQPVLDIICIDTVRVRIEIPEVFYDRVRVGDQLTISFDAAPKRKFVGTVQQIIPRANERSRAFPVKIDIENPDYFLAPGMLARVMMKPASDFEKSMIIPKDAIVAQGPMPVVYRVVEGEGGALTAERLEVTTGKYYGEAVEVFGDLKAGDQVIIRGNERVQPGQTVQVSNFLSMPQAMGNQQVNPGRSGE
jgi:multidrug resistance efflux pump